MENESKTVKKSVKQRHTCCSLFIKDTISKSKTYREFRSLQNPGGDCSTSNESCDDDNCDVL